MLRAFVDDSADEESPVFVLSGYAASIDQWKAFTAEWEHALRGLHLPYFKMTEANAWSLERQKEVLPYLHNVIANNVHFAFQVVVDNVALKEEFEGFLGHNVSTPYYFSFFRLIMKILQRNPWPGGGDKIEFIFDQQEGEKDTLGRCGINLLMLLPLACVSA